jgi:hypothetical protein
MLERYGIRASESSITARIRDLRKDKFGNHTIEDRPPANGGSWFYRIKEEA